LLLLFIKKEQPIMGATSPIETARTLGKYELIEKLGEGNLGPVYRGIDHEIGQAVVIRVLCDGIKWDEKIEDLFQRECHAVAGLKHPNIAAVYAVGKEGPVFYLAMESLGNSNLKDLIAQQPTMSVESKISIMIQAAEGLSYAHKNHILHRDFSPIKIHRTPDGSIKIRDFAIAHVLKKHLPRPAIRWGVPIYLSPEQIQNKDCDVRSDIFSAGIVFYEFLTGLHPFHDSNGNKALDNILLDVEIPTFERFPDMPPGIWPILKACLARAPRDRYQSLEDLLIACRELQTSLAEDTRLMLAELYAALTPLRKAAARPNASETTIKLLQDIQKLSQGNKEADYCSLDKMMTILIEQYPTIHAAEGAPDPINEPFSAREMAGSMIAQDESQSGIPNEINDALPKKQANQTNAQASVPETVFEAEEAWPIVLESLTPRNDESAPVLMMEALEEPGPESQFFTEEPESRTALPVNPLSSGASSPIAEDTQPELFNPASLAIDDQDRAGEPAPNTSVASKGNAGSGNKTEAGEPLQAVSEDAWFDVLPSPAVPSVEQGPIQPAVAGSKDDAASISTPVISFSSTQVQAPPADQDTVVSQSRNRKISRPSYRTVVVLLSILVIAAAGYIVWGTEMPAPVRNVWNQLLDKSPAKFREFIRKSKPAADTSKTGEKKLSDLKSNAVPLNPDLKGNDRSVNSNSGIADSQAQEQFARVSVLINSGKLQAAKIELNKLQQIYPGAPEIGPLRKQWMSKSSKEAQDQALREEEQQKASRKQREDEWDRQSTGLFERGKYGEVGGVLSVWLAENPGNGRAQEFSAKIDEIQRSLKVYASAMAESRYSDAAQALHNAERINPTDPNIAELRRQMESRKAVARATLTVRRLGAKANILLDGRLIGKDGEIENEVIPIGNHTLSIENDGGVVASKSQEYFEGLRYALVYDTHKLNLRPMVEGDRELLVQRKAMEEVHRFDLDHVHGALRGSCRGLLSIDFYDIAYKPSSGTHGFRIPFKLLKLGRVDGRSVELFYISDGKHFQSFKFQDDRELERFKQVWSDLKALAR
jgi:serine/threonine protein kinase